MQTGGADAGVGGSLRGPVKACIAAAALLLLFGLRGSHGLLADEAFGKIAAEPGTARLGTPHEMVLRVVDLYNRHDAPGLYALFAPRAKSQFSLADLTRRMPIIQERAEKVEGLRYLRAETGLRDGGLVLHMLVYHIHASGRLGNWEGEMKFSFAEDLHSFDGWTVKLDPTSSS